MASEEERSCPGCGAPVLRMRTVLGRVAVDAEPIWIRLRVGGDSFILKDGRMVFGDPAGDADDDQDAEFLEGHRPHRAHCPNNGRRPRAARRNSGYR